MTAILAIAWPEGALVAGDGAFTSDGVVTRSRTPKVATRSGYLVGACGDAAYVNVVLFLLRAKFKGGALLPWAVEYYVPELRKALEERSEVDKGQVLLAAAGHIVTVDSAGACHDYDDGFASIGVGSEVALGAMHVCSAPPHQRARVALVAASHHVEGVSSPWSYVDTDGGHGRL